MTEACKRYSRFLNELGLTGHVQNSFAVKQRLMEHFGDQLQFHRPASCREPEPWKKALDDQCLLQSRVSRVIDPVGRRFYRLQQPQLSQKQH